MKEKELEFNRIVKANKAVIFTVCYLFSKDWYLGVISLWDLESLKVADCTKLIHKMIFMLI